MKYKDFIRYLREHGYVLIRTSGHHMFSNGSYTIAVPNSKNINRMICRRLLKEIKYPNTVEELNYYV